MVRIFTGLSAFAVCLLGANILLGLYLGDLGDSSRRYEAARSRAHELELQASATNATVLAARVEKDQMLAALGTMRRRFQPHIWLGIVSALVAVLVNCVSVTYFIGTSRWCREVVDAYGLDERLAEQSRRLKRRSFPFALSGMLLVVGIVALGAASDPGASLASPASWVLLHAAAAMLGTALIAGSFFVQSRLVGDNFQVINEILAAAEGVRRQHRPTAEPSSEPVSV
ncbi:MAG: hypothetical protein AB7F89_12930 [Pirellulaceae bacterium]